MIFKRFCAYLIDILIIFSLTFFIDTTFKNEYDLELSILNQRLFENRIDKKEYFESYKHLIHESDKKNIGVNIASTVIIMIFTVLIPYCMNTTIGYKIFKLKIYSDNVLTKNDLIGRSVLLYGLGFMLFMFMILYIPNDNIYFILINLFSFLQLLVVIISAFMVLYSYKHLSIADRFTNTRIEEIK